MGNPTLHAPSALADEFIAQLNAVEAALSCEDYREVLDLLAGHIEAKLEALDEEELQESFEPEDDA